MERVRNDHYSDLWVDDTIVAISTGAGQGAIGIVRMSGPRAIPIAAMMFAPLGDQPWDLHESHRLVYGHVIDPRDQKAVDEALMATMRKPRSYTREDVVEFHCHGGLAAQRAVLHLTMDLGARPAEPGEFTRRAFLNGRIDLAQAESVAAIVGSRSTGALKASVRRLEGGLSAPVRECRGGLMEALAYIEASVDFSDEDIESPDWEWIGEKLSHARDGLGILLSTAFVGRALEEGVRTAIVGRPNVGKSSLLNALLMRERAIVSAIPGTTRDTIEELVEIGGIPISLVDTAGMRSGGDTIERLGVERSRSAMAQADLVLLVVDLSTGLDDEEASLVEGLDPDRSILVGNKRDIAGAGSLEAYRARRRVCAVSALTGQGLEDLRALVEEIVTAGRGLHLEEPLLANERQRRLVEEARDRTESALLAVAGKRGEELVCEDLRGAVRALGMMTGDEFTPDLLDEIFGRFCVGK